MSPMSLILIVWAAEQGFMVPVGSSKTLEAWAERWCQERSASTSLDFSCIILPGPGRGNGSILRAGGGGGLEL